MNLKGFEISKHAWHSFKHTSAIRMRTWVICIDWHLQIHAKQDQFCYKTRIKVPITIPTCSNKYYNTLCCHNKYYYTNIYLHDFLQLWTKIIVRYNRVLQLASTPKTMWRVSIEQFILSFVKGALES